MGVCLGDGRIDYATMSAGCVSFLLLFTLTQIPYWTLRRFKQWRIEHSTQPRVATMESRAKFGVLDVFAWTAYLAVPLALVGQMSDALPIGSEVLQTVVL